MDTDDNYDAQNTLTFDFRTRTEWGYSEDHPRHVVYMKRWQKLMRKDMSTLFAAEIEPNLYEVDQFFLENGEERLARKGDGRCYLDITIERILPEYLITPKMPYITHAVLYWAREGQQIQSDTRRLWGNDLSEIQRQHAYLGWHAEKNLPCLMLNYGKIPEDGLIYDLNNMDKPDCTNDFDIASKMTSTHIRAAHHAIRMMLKWFASNEGQKFIAGCERNLRIKHEHDRSVEMPHYSQSSPIQRWLANRP